jgi:hydrogenase maturation protein HypF
MTDLAGAARVRITLRGAVQGVGFRPFAYRLATELALAGFVRNTGAGLAIEVEGPPESVERFLERLEREHPAAAVVAGRQIDRLPASGALPQFAIQPSDRNLAPTAAVLPDLATCPACLAEILDPGDRRYLYPFTNCTACGPRQTIVLDIPYDRARTTMREFIMCAECRREYENPGDRRFEAQPNACARCGPRLESRIEDAAEALAAGRIVALKGIGGYQLLADARNDDAVRLLRTRKLREQKPFAVMMPSLEIARRYCRVGPVEEGILKTPAAPIVLLEPTGDPVLAASVSKDSPYIGAMLPYSPLHHLLLRNFPFPIVATSGNRSEEPISIENTEARDRLGEIADLFLHHNRPIARPCDDSVVRIRRGRPALIRRARGYAPLPVTVPHELPRVLAVGGHLKNAVAIGIGSQVFLSPHVGDLDSIESRRAFEAAVDDLLRLYRFHPDLVVCDLHPDYASTRWARASGLQVVEVQHHHAHIAACAAENHVEGPYLGVAWDGSGYGLDGTVWGGEMFAVEGSRFERIGSLRAFRLPGGEAAVREGWRVASALLIECGLSWPETLDGRYRAILERVIERGINAPVASSVGRLFDAVAALTGVCSANGFEGQAAMRLECAAGHALPSAGAYPLQNGDWRPMIGAVVADVCSGVAAPTISARFHNALAEWIGDTARRTGLTQVVTSGGVFQNRYLSERVEALLESRGFRMFQHRQVPANDGGIALGQAVLSGLVPR